MALKMANAGVFLLLIFARAAAIAETPTSLNFHGPNSLSLVRIAVVDAFNGDEIPATWSESRTGCLAVTAATLARYSFAFVKGQADSLHAARWMEQEYCPVGPLEEEPRNQQGEGPQQPLPRYLLIVSSCLAISDPDALVDAVMKQTEAMRGKGIVISGHIIDYRDSDKHLLPYMHPQLVLIDTRIWRSLGCPSLGPFTLKDHFSSFPAYTAIGDVHDNYTPLFLNRAFTTFSKTNWYKTGTGSFLTPVISASLRKNISIWNVGSDIRVPRVYAYPMFAGKSRAVFEKYCAVDSLCHELSALNDVSDIVKKMQARTDNTHLPFTFQRSTHKSGCYDRGNA